MARLANYADLETQVRLRLKGNPESGVILEALRRIGNDFCSRSNIWNGDLPAINLVSGTKAYAIADLGASAEIHEISGVRTLTAAQVTAGDYGTPISLSAVQYDPASLTVTLPASPASSVTGGLIVKAVLVPTFDSNEIADWILRQWPYGLAAGAAAGVANEPSNIGSYDPKLAGSLTVEYDRAVAEATRFAVTRGRALGQVITRGFRLGANR